MFFLDKIQKNKGMTYVELIVVLSISAVLASVSIFNYGLFQEKIDMKNLSNDIALKIIEAQKSSVAGKLPISGVTSTWKPSYGIYFDLSVNNTAFYYFTDLNQDKKYSCPGLECASAINITKGNKIFAIKSHAGIIEDSISYPLHISYTRPNSGADFYSNSGPLASSIEYIQIVLSNSDESSFTNVNIYPSGRVDITQNED